MVAISILLIYSFIHIKGAESCQRWNVGLNGVRLQYDQASCSIPELSTCWYDLGDDWFNWFKGDECNPFDVNKEYMDLYYPEEPFVGFPRLEKLPFKGWQIISKVFKNIVPLDSFEEKRAKDLEIVLKKTDIDHPSFIIQVKRDEQVVQERRKIDSSPLSKNVLMIFIDALSRPNAFRKLPKTMAWFDQFSGEKHATHKAFEFFKYHSVASTIIPLICGESSARKMFF